MQQVEAGRLDLDVDVNRYLTEFTVPATYPRPVTLRDLMNHTAGFEDFIIATAARTAADVPPLGRFLAEHMPARIRPPGEISAYSNYGAALAGHIVARVSGEPYDVYVQRHLLDPLGMTHSTATEPVPAGFAADVARSYDSDADPVTPIPLMFDRMPPDGSVTATAADLANFMNAHLNAGRFGATSILTPATTARMHERSFAADPRLDGYAHGFKERTINGHRILMHDGGWEGFRSVLMMVPACDLGLFLTTNATGGGGPGALELVDAFFDRFAPDAPEAAASGDAAGAGAATRVAGPRAGFYQPTRHNESTVEKVTSLLGPSRLVVNGDGTVRFKGKVWTPQGEGLFRADDGADRLVFLAGSGGRRYVATDGVSYELMSRGETLPFNLVILLVVLIPALGVLTWPVIRLLRRVLRRPATTTGTWRAARALTAGSLLLGIAFLVGLAVTLFGDTTEFLYRVPLGFRLLLAVPVIALGTGAVAVAYTIKGWRGSGAGVVARIHQVTLLAGVVALTWFLWQWNLLGWQYA
jgi:CubicO group peptidase (beta-lactamase class C family)